jgi:hypothetical protein
MENDELEKQKAKHRDGEDDGLDVGYQDSVDFPGNHGKGAGEGVEVRAEYLAKARKVLEKQRHSDRCDQRGDLGRMAQGAVRQLFDQHGEDGAPDDRRHEHRRQRHLVPFDGVESDEGADHEYVPVGEIDKAHDPVDHGVPEGDQRVHEPELQPVDDLL